ncbi:MAG: CesT family type III secretion system chaperone [Parachlamydiales bacterium]|jgi:hypothetical protein
MIDKYEELLNYLSNKLDIELRIDSNQSCSILFDDTISVQLELDESAENLIIFSSAVQLPAGKFRENILLNGLKENDKYPIIATFGYYEKANTLAIFNFLNLLSTDNEAIYNYLKTFVDLVFLYHDSVSKGQASPLL